MNRRLVVGQDGILRPIGNRPSVGLNHLAMIALRATEWDGHRHRPDTIRPQDAILPQKAFSRCVRLAIESRWLPLSCRARIRHQSCLATLSVTVPDSVYRQIADLAAREQVSEERIVAADLAEQVSGWARVEQMAKHASREDFLAALDKVPAGRSQS